MIPPPELPKPATKAFEVPTMFLSKKPVDHTWHGTKLPPRMPTKKRTAMSWPVEYAVPARKVGMAPIKRQPAKVYLGPNLSQAGPATNRTRSVATRATMFELRTSLFVMWRSLAMVTDRSGGNAYQDQNAMRKPNL